MININKNMMLANPYSYESMRDMENKMCWHMNDLCNLRCEYCFFDYYNKENPLVGKYSPEEIYQKFKETRKNWYLFLSGGEPLLYPNFNKLVNLLRQDHGIQISTNLSNNKVKSFAEEVGPENICLINASLHIPEKNKNSLKKFIQNYHILREKGFEIMVSYVTYPPLLPTLKEDFKKLKEEGISNLHPITFQGVYNKKIYPKEYTINELKLIDSLSLEPFERLITKDETYFKGLECRAGRDYFYMELDGEVYNCATIRKSHGNLFEGTFKPRNCTINCPADKCNDSSQGITSLVRKPNLPPLNENNFFIKQFNFFKNKIAKIG